MTKSKNTLLNRIVAVLLIITIFPHTDISVLAAENDGDSYTVYSVNAISSEEENPFTAYFLCRDNNLFINIDSAGQLIGGPGVLEDDYYVFTTKYNKKIEISKNSCCLVSDNFYIPFIDFIIQGNIYIQTEGNVLVAEVLMTEEEAKSIISETYDTRLNDPFLMARDDKSMQIAMNLSTGCDVLYNFKIFSASQYLHDKCRSAILTLIKQNYETESDVFYLDEFHSTLKKFSLYAELETHGWSRYEWYAYAAESVGGAYGLAFLKSYGELDELIDIDGLMSIIELSLSYGQQNINILHGLEAISAAQFNPFSDISIVTKELSAFYNSKNIGSAELIASSFFAKHLETTLSHGFNLSNGEFFWTEISVGIEKLLFDEFLDVQTRMDTISDLETFFQIQKAARNYWKEVRNKNLTKDHILIQRDVALTFLYSQLCAISSYENSDKSINFSRNEKSILLQIRSLSSISDLSMGKTSEIESQRKPEFFTNLVDFLNNFSIDKEIITESSVDDCCTLVLHWDYSLVNSGLPLQFKIWNWYINQYYCWYFEAAGYKGQQYTIDTSELRSEDSESFFSNTGLSGVVASVVDSDKGVVTIKIKNGFEPFWISITGTPGAYFECYDSDGFLLESSFDDVIPSSTGNPAYLYEIMW